MRPSELTADELFIQLLKNAASDAANQADLAIVNDDPETAHHWIENAYAAFDEIFEIQRRRDASCGVNDNVPDAQAIEA